VLGFTGVLSQKFSSGMMKAQCRFFGSQPPN
jgi:hypothetical protein